MNNALIYRENIVTAALLEALALLLVDSEERLAKSHFRDFLDNNELGLALAELSLVVNNVL
jgi:hypothetical protein